MMRQMLLGKIHRAVVTAADVNYVGSITVDSELLDAAGILPYERVQVVDVENGARLETYTIPGAPGKGEIQLNGAAARLVAVGDHVIIMNYGWLSSEEITSNRPKVVLIGEDNRIKKVMHYGE